MKSFLNSWIEVEFKAKAPNTEYSSGADHLSSMCKKGLGTDPKHTRKENKRIIKITVLTVSLFRIHVLKFKNLKCGYF